MSYTGEELKRELRKLGVRDNDLIRLLHPEVKALDTYKNIRVGYLGIEEWLTYQPVPQQKQLRAAVQKFRITQADYRKQMMDNLTTIAKRDSGKAMLAEIAAVNKLTLTIKPYRPEDDEDHNAESDGLSSQKSTVLGFKVRRSDGTPIPGLGEGTGEGSLVHINFTPSMWGPSGSANIAGPGSQPDEVLFHELVHAGRQMKGISHSKKVDSNYHNEEEFVAIIVANIYLSEKKQKHLRGTHAIEDRKIGRVKVGEKFDVLPDPEKFLDNPQKMTPEPRHLLETIRTRQRKMWDSLVAIGPTLAAFNPARDWEALRKKIFIDL